MSGHTVDIIRVRFKCMSNYPTTTDLKLALETRLNKFLVSININTHMKPTQYLNVTVEKRRG